MSRLPKVYLRIDPNLAFTHPDPGSFVRLLCLANAQPVRGRFKDWALVVSLLGREVADLLRARRDLVRHRDGRWYVDAWDDWQEGDLEVGERVRRFRDKKRTAQLNKDESDRAVTGTLPERYPPSETKDIKALGVETAPTEPITDSAPPSRRTWLTPYAEAWKTAYGGAPNHGQLAKAFRPLEDQHGVGEVLSRWVRYLAETDGTYASPSRFASTFGSWAVGPGTALAPARASPVTPRQQTRRDSMVAAVMGGMKGDGTLGEKS